MLSFFQHFHTKKHFSSHLREDVYYLSSTDVHIEASSIRCILCRVLRTLTVNRRISNNQGAVRTGRDGLSPCQEAWRFLPKLLRAWRLSVPDASERCCSAEHVTKCSEAMSLWNWSMETTRLSLSHLRMPLDANIPGEPSAIVVFTPLQAPGQDSK